MADQSDQLAEQVHNAEHAAIGLTGWVLAAHKLELAFVHALAGAEKHARAAVDEAEAELAKYPGSFEHLKRELALLTARVEAVLSHTAKKPAAAKAKGQDTTGKA